MKKFCIVLLVGGFILNSQITQAQLNPDMLTYFHELDGTSINDISSDQHGNIWIASLGGLLKFDGYEFTRYHPDLNDSTTMGELLTYQLFLDDIGNMWIGCQDGIYCYNPSTKLFKRYTFDHLVKFPEYALAGATTIVSNGNGRIYFGIASTMGVDGTNALIYFDQEEKILKSFEHKNAVNLHSVYNSTSDPEGNIYLFDFNGVYKIDPNHQLTEIQAPENLYVYTGEGLNGVACDSSGILWLTTSNSRLISYDPGTEKVQQWSMKHLFSDDITNDYFIDLEIDDDQNIWIGTQKGLVFFNRKTSSFSTFNSASVQRVRPDRYRSLHFDIFGNLWIGTDSDGLLKYSNRAILSSFTYNIQDKNSITFGWIAKIIESKVDGSIWIQSYQGGNGGINRLDPETHRLTPYPTPSIAPGTQFFRLISELYPGRALVNKNRGYGMFDFENFSMKDTILGGGLDTVYINTVLKDKRGTYWYGTMNGLYSIDKENGTTRYFDLREFPSSNSATNEISMLLESSVNGLWILTSYGLFSYDYGEEKIFRHAWDKNQGDVLSSQDINSFYEDDNGIAWVGTWLGGLCRYDTETGKIITYTVNDGLPSMSIQGIIADEKNNALWLSTFSGISRFNLLEEKFNNFTLSDGIQGLLFGDFVYLKSSKNIFLFGGNNGVTLFNPDEIAQKSIQPIVNITDFKVDDESVVFSGYKSQPSEQLMLSHSQNNVTFEYTGIQYDNPANNIFAYMLENYDNSWRDVKNLKSAFYYNLPPGSYTFLVKAANSNGVWNEEGASLSFRITPPWWKTWWAYVIYGLILIAAIIFVDRVQRQRLVEKAKRQAKEKELEQAREIEKAYNKLKTTQAQLLHAEKMASLGELTAGIAHEIQNPLNFVNNFAEVNAELIAELKEEIKKGDTIEVLALADNIAGNEEKIIHHGKRADGIVKGMLQHSRDSGQEKEPTDINALADEYLRLSYHGLRAKDKSFNADFKTDFDESLPKIKLIPQDIGRVILNLINNAFYAVAEKQKNPTSNKNYKPLVIVSTKVHKDHIEVCVTDNGNGIPKDAQKKIFQPFFTTKPSGEGTGLGLSLSYDIITKGHGGELKVDTIEGERTTFTIRIPL